MTPRLLVHPAEIPVCEDLETSVLIIGGGVAGLSAALAAAKSADVLVITKAWLSDTNTDLAQGGVAAVLSAGDTTAQHGADTIAVGYGLCHESIVDLVVSRGPQCLQQLIEWGGQFDRNQSGELALALEGGHSAGRVIHAGGDTTGREVQRILVERARLNSRIRIMEHTFALDCEIDEGRVIAVLSYCSGRFLRIRCGAAIVTTGGCGQIYRETTNRDIATGDGHGLMFRAGVRLRGMEFMQFHPTTLYIAGSSRLLISEAARGEGAILRDCDGVAFMEGIDPRGELAPRDVVSRAVLTRMVQTSHTNVYLDLTHLPAHFVRERFPRIHRVCVTFGLDITKEPIPVTPAAHYMMGGAVVDVAGHTSVEGLFAAGEVACSGLHGANRLASNSLLEGLVLGKEAGTAAAEESKTASRDRYGDPGSPPPDRQEDLNFHPTDLWNSLTSLMWRQVGLLRNQEGLLEAVQRLESWEETSWRLRRLDPRDFELRNLLQVAQLMATSASLRKESRGVHHREDHPGLDDLNWRVDLEIWRNVDGGLETACVPMGEGNSMTKEHE